jgi:hypothetical protein
VSDAWIGSSGPSTAEIQELISACLKGNRAVLLAHEKRFPDDPAGGAAEIQPIMPLEDAGAVEHEAVPIKIKLSE